MSTGNKFKLGNAMSALMILLTLWPVAALLVVLFVHGANVKSPPPSKGKSFKALAQKRLSVCLHIISL